MRWAEYPGLSREALNAIKYMFMREKQREIFHSRRRGNMTTEVEIEVMQLPSKACHQEVERAKNRFSPGACRRNEALPTP